MISDTFFKRIANKVAAKPFNEAFNDCFIGNSIKKFNSSDERSKMDWLNSLEINDKMLKANSMLNLCNHQIFALKQMENLISTNEYNNSLQLLESLPENIREISLFVIFCPIMLFEFFNLNMHLKSTHGVSKKTS